MANKKRTACPFRPFEGKNQIETGYLRLTNYLLTHENFKNLSQSTKVVYLYMRHWSKGNEFVDYPQRLAKNYGICPKTFCKARDELVEKGFIIVSRTSKCSRVPNQYRFIGSWWNI